MSPAPPSASLSADGPASPPLAQTGARLSQLVEVMNRLLAPDGCPWDREQTMESLRPFLLEEAAEVLEALDHGDVTGHRDELGDVLFQIVFQAALRAREGAFGIDDVCAAIEHKMKSRHPHVFGDVQVKDAAEVLQNWNRIKAAELASVGVQRRTLDGIPVALPSLLRAQRLGEKAASVGFDWPDVAGVREKLSEEIAELDVAMAAADSAAIEHELGDVLFTLTRLSAKLGISPEDALRRASLRFSARFNAMEDRVMAQAKDQPPKNASASANPNPPSHPLKGLTLAQMNDHWEAVKRELP